MAKPKIKTLESRIKKAEISRISTPGTDRIRGSALQKIIRRIAVRDNYICGVCGQFSIHGQVDHIIPLHLGGAESDNNRQWICIPCHDIKSAEEEKARNG
jgi:5-methylcytosine-specific restriction protein A